MTPELWITLGILVAALILFITEIVRFDIVALGVMVALMLTGVLTIQEGLAGFSNTVVLSFAALFIVGGAVFQTGLAGNIADRILKVAGGNETRLLVILMSAITVMSAFISSTGVVALMLPAVINLARSSRISPSKLMIPMAYAALFGGTLTLIATPPNLIASDALRQAGFEPFDFFTLTPIGLLLSVVGIVYMLLVGRRLLRDRRSPSQVQSVITPGELFALYELPGNLFRLRVQDESPLVGQTIGESSLRSDFGLNVITIAHVSETIRLPLPMRLKPDNGETEHVPSPDTRIYANDVLLVQGTADDVGRATGALMLAVLAAQPVVEGDVITNEVGIAEVLVRPRSSLIGRTIAELRFGSTYHLTVLDLRRPGEPNLSVKDTPLKFGDTLLVQGEWKDIFALKRQRRDFIVMGEREALQLGAFTRPGKAPITLIVMILMIGLVAFNVLELVVASLIAALVLILTGCVTVDEAYEAIDLKTLVLMAGMLPMSTALEKVGVIELAAGGLIDVLGQGGPVLVLAGIFALTMLLSQLLSNTATAVLLAPLALATAQGLGVQPQAFLVAVALSASMAFGTPLASPVNTLVMSAGNYKFMDYVRVGFPLLLLTLLVSVILLPILYPM